MLFEDLFFDDETHAPVNNTNIRVNQLGRTINLQAEYLEDGEVIRWNRVPEVRRASSSARATGPLPAPVVTA
ncbi:MAG TPA: hypothetical protein PLQ56_07850 [Aggregatilineales bacterium]|nr:hypothetical protein [Aggregatilineales bacterium]